MHFWLVVAALRAVFMVIVLLCIFMLMIMLMFMLMVMLMVMIVIMMVVGMIMLLMMPMCVVTFFLLFCDGFFFLSPLTFMAMTAFLTMLMFMFMIMAVVLVMLEPVSMRTALMSAMFDIGMQHFHDIKVAAEAKEGSEKHVQGVFDNRLVNNSFGGLNNEFEGDEPDDGDIDECS